MPSAETRRARVEGHPEAWIEGWEAASCEPDSHLDPGTLDDLEWLPAKVPGTAAGALRDAGRWSLGDEHDFDAKDWWFRTGIELEPIGEDEELILCLDGVATHCEVFLDGELVHTGNSMFATAEIDLTASVRPNARLAKERANGTLGTEVNLAIRCRALGPMLRVPRKPRARWRTKLVDGGLRFHRTMLLGRAPGIAPSPAAVGPWRPVRIERRRLLAVERLALWPRLEGDDGVLAVEASLRGLGASPSGVEVELSGPSGTHRAELRVEPKEEEALVRGSLTVPDVARWWPHTHGEPALHEVRLLVEAGGETVVVGAGRVGFRSLAAGPTPEHDVEEDGLDLHVNGVRVFARGAVWTPVDPVGLAPSEAELRAALEQVREAGMNMLRVVGTGAYESEAFHDLCDELGILVWQDFMFANLDYPIGDEGFRAGVEREAAEALAAVAGRPSLAVLCGNSEVEQQVAMLGLDPELGRGELFGELLPRLAGEAGVDAPYLPSAPCGGGLPFRTDRGVANYFGVGGYRRPLADARRAGVRFASECLALSNLPAGTPEGEPPRDVGAEWDFADVRDHYLGLLFDLDPAALREADPERYLELSRAVSGEVMAAVFGEWRRSASPCGGGLVLWLRDLAPGPGWGLVDHRGTPKPVYHHLRRAFAPACVWMTDEGLNGVDVHVANDGPEPLTARLRIGLYRDFEVPVGDAGKSLELASHSSVGLGVESLLGHFADVSWAYRFGPPAQHLIVATLERDTGPDGGETIARAFHFPAGRPTEVEPAEKLGLEADVETGAGGAVELTLRCSRFVYGLHVDAPGFVPDDDFLSLEPGRARRVSLRPAGEAAGGEITLSAPNMREQFKIPL
jgi:beta-mannosidase